MPPTPHSFPGLLLSVYVYGGEYLGLTLGLGTQFCPQRDPFWQKASQQRGHLTWALTTE